MIKALIDGNDHSVFFILIPTSYSRDRHRLRRVSVETPNPDPSVTYDRTRQEAYTAITITNSWASEEPCKWNVLTRPSPHKSDNLHPDLKPLVCSMCLFTKWLGRFWSPANPQGCLKDTPRQSKAGTGHNLHLLYVAATAFGGKTLIKLSALGLQVG